MVTTERAPGWDPSSPAPGGLEPVRRFANTLDCYRHHDGFTDVGAARAALQEVEVDGANLLPTVSTSIQLDDLRKLRRARAALRATLGCVTLWDLTGQSRDVSSTHPSLEVGEKEHPELVLPGSLELSERGVQFVPSGGWVDALISRLSVELLLGTRTNQTARLKVCANPDCQWLFWDASRPGTGRWCSMQLCGGQAKSRRYREKRTDGANG